MFIHRLFPILLLTPLLAFGQPDIVAKFVARSQPYSGGTLPYRLFIPDNYDSTRSYPLVLTLHGSGESGTDNLVQIRNYRIATTWADPANQAAHPCFVASPQCPAGAAWGDFRATLIALLDSLGRQYSIDSDRVYVTGLSLGGSGTWDLISSYPGRFAAGVPMSGVWHPSVVDSFRNISVWDFHGAIDIVVPVQRSREMINAIEDHGRTVIYTHGHGSDYRGMPDSTLAALIRAHADVLYTEYQFGGHIIWDEAYDTPLLHEWLFDKSRRREGALAVQGLAGYPSLSGTAVINFSTPLASAKGNPPDSVEVWFGRDAGTQWTKISAGTPVTEPFTWNTATLPDAGLGLLKAFLRDSLGHLYAVAQSGLFRINNVGNGAPSVHILKNAEIASGSPLAADTATIRFIAADPEDSLLTTVVLYSGDGGATFQLFDTTTTSIVRSDTLPRAVTLHLRTLPNSPSAVVQVTVSDGQNSSNDRTILFSKQSPRTAEWKASPVSGGTKGTVQVHVVDQALLTGHQYRVTFFDSSFTKWYDVEDVTLGTQKVRHATGIDGISEGPLFDGIRLLVTDHPRAVFDPLESRWEAGSSRHTFAVFLPTLYFETDTLQGFPQPADYRITIADHVVDTSSTAVLNSPATPMRFSVWNITENRKTAVAYLDNDGDGLLSDQDEVYFLEPDSLSSLRLTWAFTYAVPSNAAPPLAGDQYVIRTLKPIHGGDTYEFTAAITALAEHTVPEGWRLEQNWPNPFNPATSIAYTVHGSEFMVHGTDVKLVVYDILGREVAVLVNENQAPGRYTVRFDGRRLATGVYLYRLQAGNFAETKKMLLIK